MLKLRSLIRRWRYERLVKRDAIGYWRLDDSGPVARDRSGHGNHGTYQGRPSRFAVLLGEDGPIKEPWAFQSVPSCSGDEDVVNVEFMVPAGYEGIVSVFGARLLYDDGRPDQDEIFPGPDNLLAGDGILLRIRDEVI